MKIQLPTNPFMYWRTVKRDKYDVKHLAGIQHQIKTAYKAGYDEATEYAKKHGGKKNKK